MEKTPRHGFVQCFSPSGPHRMAYQEWGDAHNPQVLVCVHGLTRAASDFNAIAQVLCAHYRVICPDLVGRGESDWLMQPMFYALPQYMADMTSLLAHLHLKQVDWFGTSLGGLIGLMMAGFVQPLVRRLLLNDIGPHISTTGMMRLASYVGRSPIFKTQAEGIIYLNQLCASFGEHTIAEWTTLNGPMLRHRHNGWALHYDPAIIVPFSAVEPVHAVALEVNLWKALDAFQGRMLVVRGADSDFLSSETVSVMVQRGRHVQSEEIAHVGHAPSFVHSPQIALAHRFFLGE